MDAHIKLFLPVLCYNHTCHTAYMFSLLKWVLFCKDNGISVLLFPITFDSLVSRARNAAVAHFLTSDATHLLFIDADIEFEPADVWKLIQAQKPVASAAYPQKWLHHDKMATVFQTHPIPENPLELCTVHSVHLKTPLGSESADVLADYCSTGFLLIQRRVFERLMEAYPDRHYVNDIDGYGSANPAYFYNFFTVEIHPETRRYESEDYGFSRLWTALGGEIHIMADVSLKHHGWYAYSGNLKRQAEFSMGNVKP